MQTIDIQIDGMSCGHCLNAVRQALSGTEGVRVDSVQMGRATVSFDEKLTDEARIESSIADAGYSASVLPTK